MHLLLYVAIKDLPDCYHKNELSSIAASDDAKVIVIAKVGGRGDDFAAYIGWPGPDEIKEPTADRMYYAEKFQSAEEVKDYGDKLSETAARVLFPQMSGFVYRN